MRPSLDGVRHLPLVIVRCGGLIRQAPQPGGGGTVAGAAIDLLSDGGTLARFAGGVPEVLPTPMQDSR